MPIATTPENRTASSIYAIFMRCFDIKVSNTIVIYTDSLRLTNTIIRLCIDEKVPTRIDYKKEGPYVSASYGIDKEYS